MVATRSSLFLAGMVLLSGVLLVVLAVGVLQGASVPPQSALSVSMFGLSGSMQDSSVDDLLLKNDWKDDGGDKDRWGRFHFYVKDGIIRLQYTSLNNYVKDVACHIEDGQTVTIYGDAYNGFQSHDVNTRLVIADDLWTGIDTAFCYADGNMYDCEDNWMFWKTYFKMAPAW